MKKGCKVKKLRDKMNLKNKFITIILENIRK
jgi:hypothetical protein